MATNFSPCKRSYVLNQFPSNVMFGMNGFHVSASGAIQGHHGPIVFLQSDKHQKSKIKTGLDGKHTVVQKIAEPHPEKEYMDIFNECGILFLVHFTKQ